MSLVIRMARAGTKKRPFYHIVVADSRSPRDGRFIERLGYFNPLLPKEKTERLKFDLEKAKAWMAKGAQPSDRVMRFLDAAGVMKRPKRNNPEKAIPRKERKAKEEAAKAPQAQHPPPRVLRARLPRQLRRRPRPRRRRANFRWRAARASVSAKSAPPTACAAKSACARSPPNPRRSPITDRSKPRTAASLRSKRCGRPSRTSIISWRGLPALAIAIAAERLANIKLYVPRERLPAPEEPDEFYHADLIGLAVVDSAGQRLGTVVGDSQFRRRRSDRGEAGDRRRYAIAAVRCGDRARSRSWAGRLVVELPAGRD